MRYVLALVSIILGSMAQYLLKVGMSSITQNSTGIFNVLSNGIKNIPLIAGIICYGFSLIFWLYVLSQMELSKAYPMVSLGYVFTIILGYWLLGESINLYKLVGVALIISGVLFITKA